MLPLAIANELSYGPICTKSRTNNLSKTTRGVVNASYLAEVPSNDNLKTTSTTTQHDVYSARRSPAHDQSLCGVGVDNPETVNRCEHRSREMYVLVHASRACVFEAQHADLGLVVGCPVAQERRIDLHAYICIPAW